MPTETTVRERTPPVTKDNGDFDVFWDVLSASERGRSFLAEYTRRNRNADTEQLLAAIARLQSLVTANKAAPAVAPIRRQLLALLNDISAAQRDLAGSNASVRAARLAELIALVERRISKLVTSPEETADGSLTAASESKVDAASDSERTHLVVVPPPEQPELPIPSPAVAQLPPITLVRSEVPMPDVAFVETPQPSAPPPERSEPSTPGFVAFEPKRAAKPVPMSVPKPANVLASIMALTEEERLALFT